MESLFLIGDTLGMRRTGSLPPHNQGHLRTRLALAGWITVILAVGILPLRNFVGHSHWDHIQWTIPAAHWHSSGLYFDVLANIILFFPLGLLLTRVRSTYSARRILLILGGGLLLAIGIEGYQVFCHNRHPSPYDVLSNLSGTALGVGAATKLFSVRTLNRLLPPAHSHPTGS